MDVAAEELKKRESMFNLAGQEAAAYIAAYQKESGKQYSQTLKEFIADNAERLSEDDALQLFILVCSASGCIQEAQKQARDIENKMKCGDL